MDRHILEYFSSYADNNPNSHFHRVIPLHDEPILNWKEASKLAPCLCKGWYELANLSVGDRIEFTRDFWLSKLSFHPKLTAFVMEFFARLDDIGVYLVQKKYEDPFEAQLVYSLAENNGFFRGRCPLSEEQKIQLQKEFIEFILPPDYLSFLDIHNGFGKLLDTGILPSFELKECYTQFQAFVKEDMPIRTSKGVTVNPKTLVPFYQSFDMPFYQCFWSEWYPKAQMGNVYYSGLTMNISTSQKEGDSTETMAFESFTDWLIFYLEKIE